MRIRRALISVYDKTGIVEFARALHTEFSVEILSTGGTARLLKDNGIPVTLVEDITGFPEMLDGRVKTLHPKIFAAILADRDNPEHLRQLAEMGIEPIDMVVVNLYPFESTVADPSCTFEQAIEMIDIGGVSLLRAAAKNHRHVLVPTCVQDLNALLTWMRGDELSEHGWERIRRDYAWSAFGATCEYDDAIQRWLDRQIGQGLRRSGSLRHFDRGTIRYGENPHQQCSLWMLSLSAPGFNLTLADSQGDGPGRQDQVSYNNFLDADAALRLCAELTRASGAIACGSGHQPHSCGTSSQPHSCGTGFQPVECGTGFQPVPSTSGFSRLQDERQTWRNLPHFETPGKTYFVTFRLAGPPPLSPAERQLTFGACLFWHGRKITVHALVVMPDHVHAVITPLEAAPSQWVSLAEWHHSVKRFSSSRINELRGRSGPLWQQERMDRIIRNAQEFEEVLNYIANNPVKEKLAEAGKYAWWWDERCGPSPQKAHTAGLGEGHRLETGGTQHRLQTGATQLQAGAMQLQTGAMQLQTGAVREPSPTAATHVCVFIKHNNPCGVGVAADPVEAYHRAYLGDPNAAMGGILAVNFAVQPDFAATVMDALARWGKAAGAGAFFLEVWVAPEFTKGAIEIIRGTAEPTAPLPQPPKKPWGEKVRLLAVDDMSVAPDPNALEYRSIAGGMLVQTPDLLGLNEDQWKVVTKRAPTELEMADLRLAWLIAKHTKSNAISIVREGQLIGNGAGQMSRVMSCRIAVWLARENGHLSAGGQRDEETKGQQDSGTQGPGRSEPARTEVRGSQASDSVRTEVRASPVAASDAFFPFADAPQILMEAGVTAIIQPGGSKRDAEVIAACDARGVAMIFTGTRHFRH